MKNKQTVILIGVLGVVAVAAGGWFVLKPGSDAAPVRSAAPRMAMPVSQSAPPTQSVPERDAPAKATSRSKRLDGGSQMPAVEEENSDPIKSPKKSKKKRRRRRPRRGATEEAPGGFEIPDAPKDKKKRPPARS